MAENLKIKQLSWSHEKRGEAYVLVSNETPFGLRYCIAASENQQGLIDYVVTLSPSLHVATTVLESHAEQAAQADYERRILSALNLDTSAQTGGWIHLGGFIDPPPAPEGFNIEVQTDVRLGTVTAYRFVPAAKMPPEQMREYWLVQRPDGTFAGLFSYAPTVNLDPPHGWVGLRLRVVESVPLKTNPAYHEIMDICLGHGPTQEISPC